MHWSVEEVEERCAALARHGQFVRVCGTDAWPDGTVATRYGFLHALYREVLYERVPVGRRVRWHQQIGHRLEAGYEPQARELAAELAEHFVRGHDTVRAVRYLHAAGGAGDAALGASGSAPASHPGPDLAARTA